MTARHTSEPEPRASARAAQRNGLRPHVDVGRPLRLGLALVWIAAFVAGCASTGAPVGFSTGPSPDVPTLLERLPAQTDSDEAEVKRDLVRLDAEAIRSLCHMLVDPGTGDDTKPRMALHALAIHTAGREGRGARRRFVDTVNGALASDLPTSAKLFLIRQLEFCGDGRAVAPLARCLADRDLRVAATRTLLAIATAAPSTTRKVSAAFRAALPQAAGDDTVVIVDALGTLADGKSVDALLHTARSDDPMLRDAALDALARCGAPAARSTLVTATKTASRIERSHAIDRLLTFARSLDARGRQADAVSILRKLIAEYEDARAVHVHCAALDTLSDVLGERALDDVVAAMDREDPEVRAAAAKIAATMEGRGVTRALVARSKDATPAGRVAILNVLRTRGDRAALPAALVSLSDEDQDVRLAAVDAAATLGGDKALDALLAALDTDVEAQRVAVRRALCCIPGRRVDEVVAAEVSRASMQMKVDLINVLAGRAALDTVDVVFAASRDPDEAVRIAAAAALEVLASPESTPDLIGLLADAGTEDLRDALVGALAATIKRAADVPAYVAVVSSTIDGESTPTFCCLLQVLGHIGGSEALAKVRGALTDDRPEAIEAAVRALADWPDASAAADLLAIARDTTELSHNVLALRGYARLLGLESEREAAETLKMYAAGIEAARRPDEVKLMLSGIGEVKDGAALAMLDPYLDDEALRSEAAAAMVGVAEAVVAADWPRCREAASRILANDPPEAIRDRARVVLDQSGLYEGHITNWLFAGPYTDGRKTGSQMFGVTFPPEVPGADGVDWRPYAKGDRAASLWQIDLGAVMEGVDAVAYLSTRVFSPSAQPATLELGSDDGIKVWLNGEIVHENNATRGCAPAQDRAEVTLNEGWNDLLLKVTNNGGAWSACARFRSPDGGPLDGVYAAAGASGEPEPSAPDDETND